MSEELKWKPWDCCPKCGAKCVKYWDENKGHTFECGSYGHIGNVEVQSKTCDEVQLLRTQHGLWREQCSKLIKGNLALLNEIMRNLDKFKHF